MPIPFLQRQKTIDELNQEKERNDVELTVLQQRKLLKKLKENGLSLKSFGNSVKEAINWARTH